MTRKRKKKTWFGSAILLILCSLFLLLYLRHPGSTQLTHFSLNEIRDLDEHIYKFPKRSELKSLSQSGKLFDIIIIGGDATGPGTCYEAATLGLKVACIEPYDWASQASSRSIKQLHGSLKFLEQCIIGLNITSCKLVVKALKERKSIMSLAPHLASEMSVIAPVYDSFLSLAFVWSGLKIYDWIAKILGYLTQTSEQLSPTKYMSASKMAKEYTFIKNNNLKGGVMYSDTTFNESRLALSLQLSAIKLGAISLNYVKVIGFEKKSGQIQALLVEDQLTGEQWQIAGKSFINASGPYVDEIRKLDNPLATNLIYSKPDVHLALPQKSNNNPIHVGVLMSHSNTLSDKNLSNWSILLPFEKQIIVRTESQNDLFSPNKGTSVDEIYNLLKNYNQILSESYQYTKDDILSEWVEYKTLTYNNQNLKSDHIIESSKSGLISVACSNWTTFLTISKEVVKLATADFSELNSKKNEKKKDVLSKLKLIGAIGFSSQLAHDLANSYKIEQDIATHLANNYGSMAIKVLDIALEKNLFDRIDPALPYIWAEVVYAAKYEYALTPFDITNRRLRLDFVNKSLSERVFARVTYLMANELQADDSWRQKHMIEFLKQKRRSNT